MWGQASPARKFEAQLPQSRGKKSRTNATDEPKFCRQQRPIGWEIRSENTTINQIIISLHVLGAYLCDAGGIGLLWVSRYHISSAALFRQLEHRLIVLNHIFLCSILPMELKLSHVKRMGIGRPPVCPYLVSAPCSDVARGPSC